MAKKYVYFFGGGKAEGAGHMRDLLGGKGAGLAEMTNIGLPVPPGFTITTEVCDEYYRNNKKYPPGLEAEVMKNLAKLEKLMGKKLGDPKDPLLVSVRSGAARSMPGMMETILNLGLTDESVQGLAKKTNNERFALDAYRRFITMYGSTAMGVPREKFDHAFAEVKVQRTAKRLGIQLDPSLPVDQQARKVLDTQVNADELREVVDALKRVYKENVGEDFPQDPLKQLWGAIAAVFGSWMAEKAVTYRRVERITGLKGTAVNVQVMVFGNMGETSGTGVCFTRDPSTGENVFYGDLLMNAQGEDVVAGIRTPIHLSELAEKNKEVYEQLCAVRCILECAYKDMQDLEFTVQEGKLYMLQCRTGKRTPRAAFRIAVEQATKPLLTRAEAKALVKKGYLPERYAKLAVKPILTKEEAVARITDKDIEGLFYPIIDPEKSKGATLLATGIDAVPGAAAGKVVFNAHEAEVMAANGEKVILVRKETSPEDVGGMFVAQGILTATGGKTSHAAVVARGWGKCCIVGCEKLAIDYEAKQMTVGDRVVKQGDWITLNGTTGEVFLGELPLIKPELPKEYYTLMSWADSIRRLKVRTNADTPHDAKIARELGAEGIGLCRTEHMFFKDFEKPEDSVKRQLAIQEMIMAETAEDRKNALDKLLPFQRRDFIGIFEVMNGLPVTIRLIDPPLHEFTPKTPEQIKALAEATGLTPAKIQQRSEQLHEANPMLGHRGCRLCITYPEILDMQVRAIMEAACECKKRGIKVIPEIMHPVVMDAKELKILDARTRQVAEQVMKEQNVKVDYLVGTMIELPRAALLADKVAEVAEFFSFGTNDLTQTVCGLSRDDAGRFLPDYVDEKKAAIFKDDPFQSLDQEGVGMLVEWATRKGREGRAAYAKAHKLPKEKAWLKVGICGEHGGEMKSVKFCHRIGMDYVSCSPFRVPIARLAAAHAVIEEKKAKAKN